MKNSIQPWLLILFIALGSCNEEKKPSKPLALIAPPIPALDIAYHTYEIDASQGGQITYEATGSSLSIPANAFIDTAGNAVKGNVKILYREFHDAVDILLSGIPMNYDSAGMEGALTTGGMFEVLAMQGAQSLALATGKKMPMRMASFQTGNEYNFYTLNQTSKKWDYQGKPAVETNQVKAERLAKAAKMKEAKPFPYNPKKVFIFNYYSLLDVYFKDNWKDIREAGKNRDMEKKLSAYGVSIYDTNVRGKDINYNKTNYAPNFMVWESTGKDIPKWARSGDAQAVIKPVRGSICRFTAQSGDKTFETDIRIVMPLQHLLRFSANYWKNNYDKALATAAEEARQAALLSETFRSFDVPALGIHNYDYFTRDGEYVTLNASFDFGLAKKEGLEVDAIDRVYFVSNDGRTIVRFDRDKWATFKLSPLTKGQLFTILPDQRVSLFTSEKYNGLPFEEWRKTTETIPYNFAFSPQGEKIESAANIHQLLGITPANPAKEGVAQ